MLLSIAKIQPWLIKAAPLHSVRARDGQLGSSETLVWFTISNHRRALDVRPAMLSAGLSARRGTSSRYGWSDIL
jgi:hypothetical protein